ncbi:MAG: bifunctional (p)ppGpp synthetase/guanosine-3',5'-bis(diphosphate) 3'-pyrophosphohydrolase [Holosporales bacterium]|nr:bifunctional (p)ppGpp synthetase/guanosine-3',5'-bis(diphosphate) 3'-pyrophosphohydrolase [Holosporales bacterium]
MCEDFGLVTPQDLINGIKEYYPNVDESLIERAYLFALTKHGTQIRESGDPFFFHPLEVAEILISLRMDQDTVIAGMLHDTIEDTNTTIDELGKIFGNNVANMVEGVSKLSKFESSSIAEKQAENFKKLLISAASDIRILIIKLADRLHNMKTLKFKKKKVRRQYIAKETLEIYAPLAERIGVTKVKDELQDIAFTELYPDIYNSIKSRLNHLYESSEHIISTITSKLTELAISLDISCTISGRIKSPYSIWSKMNVRNISFEQLADIMAFRIVVDNVAQCYQMLGGIHKNYLVVPNRFRDYISTPKNNNYQSLHTSVIGPLNKKIEIQIRTKEMHLVAEYGIAAHWDYKENGSRTKVDHQWINNLVHILENASGMEEFWENSKTEISSNAVYCITPKGNIVSLPKGSSVLDFAYSIHSDVGNSAIESRLNGQLVPLNTKIENGDQVEILTDQNHIPEPHWEDYVVTLKAKTAIKKALNSLEKERIFMIGRSNFYEFFKWHNVDISEKDVQAIAKNLKFDSATQLFYSIGTCELTMSDVLSTYNEIKQTGLKLIIDNSESCKNTLPIRNLPNIPVLPVTCCSPVPGDRIVGIISRGKGIEIHIEECQISNNQIDGQEKRLIPLSWSKEAFDEKVRYLAKLAIVVVYEPGNLSAIATIIEGKNGNIINLKIGEKFEKFARIQIELEISDIAQLTIIMAALRSAEFIQKVTRT